MPLQDYPPGELLPHHLTREEIEDPYLVLESFFDVDHLPGIRVQLWDLLTITASSNFHKLPRREKSDMLYLFTKLRQLIEAVHLLHQRHKPETDEIPEDEKS